MSAPPVEEIVCIDPRIEQVLGKTAAQIRNMSLRELAEAAFEKGFTWRVNESGGAVKGLTIRVADDEPQAEVQR